MLTVITGPMFSGKSSALISRCMANVIADRYVIVFSPDNDIRYDKRLTKITSHNMETFPAVVIGKDYPQACWDIILVSERRPNVIAFDEAQFFGREEMLETVDMLTNDKYDIILAGLSQDFKGRPFGAMPELLAIADEIVSLKAVCSSCKGIGIATRTYRKSNDGKQIVVGGVDKYEAICYACWSSGNEV